MNDISIDSLFKRREELSKQFNSIVEPIELVDKNTIKLLQPIAEEVAKINNEIRSRGIDYITKQKL